MKRLEFAKKWLSTWMANNIPRAYRRLFGVDIYSAFIELEMLGLQFDPSCKENVLKEIEAQRLLRKKERKVGTVEILDDDDYLENDCFYDENDFYKEEVNHYRATCKIS